MNYLVLLRHGQSEWNLKNLFTGWENPDLTEKGETEARNGGKALGPQGAGIRFDAVYTSDLTRAQRTAALALEAAQAEHLKGDGPYGFRMIVDTKLRERSYGDLVGLNKAQTAEKYGEEQVRLWRRDFATRPPGGESLEDVVARVQPYFEATIMPQVKAGDSILVAAHGNSLRAALVALGIHKPEDIPGIEIPTGVPLVFEVENGEIGRHYYLKS